MRLLATAVLVLSLQAAWAQEADLGRLLSDAARAAAQGDLAAAETAFAQALDAAADDEERAQVLSRLGDMRRGKGDREGAFRAYQQCLELQGDGPWRSRGLTQLGGLARQLGHADVARKAYERLAEDFADQPNIAGQAELNLCRLDARLGRSESVIPRLERLLGTEYPASIRNQARYLLVEVLLRAGHFERAGQVAAAEAANSGMRADLLVTVARELQRVGQLVEAEGLCRQVLAEQPGHPTAARRLYEIAAEGGTLDDLKSELTRAAEGDGADTALRRLADVLTWEGETQPALAIHERLVKLSPEDPQVLLRAGEVARNAGELGKAATWLEAALRLSPEHRLAAESLGEVYARQGEHERAVEAFKLSTGYDPGEPRSARALGRVLSEYSLHHEAVAVYERAREQSRDETLFAYELGRTRVGMLDYRRATEEFLVALSDPMRGSAMMVSYELMKLARDEVAGEIVVGALDEWSGRGDLTDGQALAAGRAYLAAKRPERALDVLASLGPGAGADIAELAREAEVARDRDLASQLYEAALRRDLSPRQRAGMSLRLAGLRLAEGDWSDALELLAAAAEVDEYRAEAELLRAEALLRNARDVPAAREAYQAVLGAAYGTETHVAEARWGLADCLFVEARWDDAEAAYVALMGQPTVSDLVLPPPPPGLPMPPHLRLVEFLPAPAGDERTSVAYGAYQLAEISLRRGDLEAAAERYTIVAGEYRASAWANDALARVAFVQQNLDGSGEAERQYLDALIALEQGDHDEVRSLLSSVADMSSEPLADDALVLLGRALCEERKWAEAVAAFERLAAEMPESLLAPSALVQAATVYRDELGDIESARAKLAGVVDGYPQSAAADEARRALDGLPSAE